MDDRFPVKIIVTKPEDKNLSENSVQIFAPR